MKDLKYLFTACIVLTLCISRASGAIFHLATPAVYDNAVVADDFGQTFIALDSHVTGFQVYIDDPARPDSAEVNELQGPSDLVLYDATILALPIELHRTTVLNPLATASGLITFYFDIPVPTTIGTRYFVGINTTDPYGIGLRDFALSTYSSGAEAFRNKITGQITEYVSGRDLSFAVLSDSSPVPEPASLLAWSTFALLGLITRCRIAIGDRVKITRGAFAGLVGRIRSLSSNHNCIVAIAGLPRGIYFQISRNCLTPHHSQPSQCSPLTP